MKLVALVSSLLFAFLVSFELTCRVEDRLRYGMPMLSTVRDQEDLVVRDAAGMHGRPHAQYEQFVLNGLGMRGPEVRLAKPSTTLRVATIGASETFGLYESDGREYPRQLEDTLRSLMAGDCPQQPYDRVEVLNAAIFGMSLPTVAQDVRLRVAATHPDVIVAYPTPPHYLDDEVPRAARPDSSAHVPATSLATRFHLRMVTRLRDQAKALLPAPVADWLRRRDTQRMLRGRPAGWRWNTIPADRLAAYDADLRTLVGTIRDVGAIPVLATHGNAFPPGRARDAGLLARWERFYPRATGATIVAFDSAARDVTLQVARDSAVVVVDAQRIMHDRMVSQGTRLFEEYAHFTDAGATLLASQVGHAVQHALASRGTLACAVPRGFVARAQRATSNNVGTP